MIKPAVIFIILLFPLRSIAQSDYVITTTNDTLYGHVTKAFRFFNNKITIQTNDGLKTFTYRNTHKYRTGRQTFMIARVQSPKGKLLDYHCRVVVDGKMRLLQET